MILSFRLGFLILCEGSKPGCLTRKDKKSEVPKKMTKHLAKKSAPRGKKPKRKQK